MKNTKPSRLMLAAVTKILEPDIDIHRIYPFYRFIANVCTVKPANRHVCEITADCVHLADRDIKVKIFSYKNCRKDHAVLFFHGGGWIAGTVDSYSGVCTSISKYTGSTVISVDYRLAPEYKFPCGFDDCYQTAKQMFCSGLFGFKPENITLAGDSAGGNICAAVSLKARDTGDFSPRKQVLIYPATGNDYTENSPFASVRENGKDYILTSKKIDGFVKLYLSDESDKYNPYFSPLQASDYRNQPDTLIITAQFCPLRDEGEEYGRRLREAGNSVNIYRMGNALHGFISLPESFSQPRKCFRIISDFIGR